MKTYWILGIAMAAGLKAYAGECSVIVYTNVDPIMPLPTLVQAESRTTAMFREIGVEVIWRGGPVRAKAADNPCGAPIVVRLEKTAGVEASPGALAFAAPFADSGTCIHVFFDRIHDNSGAMDTLVLSHVLAHEIGHVLERMTRHSEEGVMKARWTLADFDHMKVRPLPFASEDVELIHRGITDRAVRGVADRAVREVAE
jgi:Zn-dependent protease with chaperone function